MQTYSSRLPFELNDHFWDDYKNMNESASFEFSEPCSSFSQLVSGISQATFDTMLCNNPQEQAHAYTEAEVPYRNFDPSCILTSHDHEIYQFDDSKTVNAKIEEGTAPSSISLSSHALAPSEKEDILAIPPSPNRKPMEPFPPEKVSDFKHVIYNLLVENYNNPTKATFCQPCTFVEGGMKRVGFFFNPKENPEKKLPELYSLHIRKARLDIQDQNSVLIQDLYKFYLRAAVELLGKYFLKRGKYTYLYDDIPLFQPGSSLKATEERLRAMKTRARKRRASIG